MLKLLIISKDCWPMLSGTVEWELCLILKIINDMILGGSDNHRVYLCTYDTLLNIVVWHSV